MSHQTIEVARQEGIATVWLNRPQARNALDETMIAEITEVFATLGASGEVRAVVLAGRGKAFCAGGDLGWMRRTADYGVAENEADAMRLAVMLHTIHQCPKPTIARVHGAAYGGGVGLAAACDIVVAASGAEFCFSEVKVGLAPATIAPYAMRALGAQAARRYMLTAERFSAAEAHRLGFVHELREADGIDAAIDAIAASLRLAGPAALAQTKTLIDRVANRPVETGLIAETATLIARIRASAEGREGAEAFLQKRPAAWTRPR
jgi:methylglutaconyl-CoA hydratase